MLAAAFYWILNMSILGSITGLFVLGLRQIKVFPRRFTYAFWVIPLIRLWLPVLISNKFSLMAMLAKLGVRTVRAGVDARDLPFTSMNTIKAAESYHPFVFETNVLQMIFSIGAVIWLTVFLSLLLVMLFLYSFTKKETRNAVHLYSSIYESDRITSPAVYGIIRPRILVPAGMNPQELSFAVMHENAHIRRCDNLIHCVALVTACFHWFNPLVWVFLKYSFADMELACDEKVMKNLDETGRRQYAASLLNCLAPAGSNLFTASFGGAKIKMRIENILSYRKLTTVSSMVFFILAAAIAVALLTNA